MLKKLLFFTVMIAVASTIGCKTEAEQLQDKIASKRFEARSLFKESAYYMDTFAAALNAATTESEALKACSDYEAGVAIVQAEIVVFKAETPQFDFSRKNGMLGSNTAYGPNGIYERCGKLMDSAIAAAKQKFPSADVQNKLNSLKKVFD